MSTRLDAGCNRSNMTKRLCFNSKLNNLSFFLLNQWFLNCSSRNRNNNIFFIKKGSPKMLGFDFSLYAKYIYFRPCF